MVTMLEAPRSVPSAGERAVGPVVLAGWAFVAVALLGAFVLAWKVLTLLQGGRTPDSEMLVFGAIALSHAGLGHFLKRGASPCIAVGIGIVAFLDLIFATWPIEGAWCIAIALGADLAAIAAYLVHWRFPVSDSSPLRPGSQRPGIGSSTAARASSVCGSSWWRWAPS